MRAFRGRWASLRYRLRMAYRVATCHRHHYEHHGSTDVQGMEIWICTRCQQSTRIY